MTHRKAGEEARQGAGAAGSGLLEIRVLGTPGLSLNGHAVELSGKSLALVCYLAVEGETRRAVLADLLWTDVMEEAARRNLRRELHRLRATPVGDWLETQGERLWLRLGHTLDLNAFHQRLEEEQAAQAARLLRGPLLDGLYPPAAEGFTSWRETRAAELVEAELSALSAWAGELSGQGRNAAAQEVYVRMLRLDPLREQTHRGLMALLHAAGEQEAALARYRALELLLHKELGVAPLPQTTELYRQILTGPTPSSSDRSPHSSGPAEPEGAPLQLPLVGRGEALQTLARHRMVLVTGEAGVGKTRLIREFLGQAQNVLLQGAPETRELPFAPLAALFAEMPERLKVLGDSARAAVSRLLPTVAAESPSGPPPETLQALTLALADALLAVLGDGVLVAEDLHWFDAPTLSVVARLIRRVQPERPGQERSGVRVLLSARTGDLLAREDLGPVLLELERTAHLVRLPLHELDAAQVERLIARLSGQAAPLFSRRLYQATAGHPLFLLETLQSLRETGELTTEDGLWQTRYDQDTTDYAEIPIPENVRAAVMTRVSRLGDAARRLLHAAAVAGEPFGAGLHSVCGLGEWDAVEVLERAEQAHLIFQAAPPDEAPDQGGPGRFRFGHDLYRHALLRDMTPVRRRLIHRQLGTLLAQAARDGQPHHPARIAAHFEAAGEHASAWPHWEAAAERSARVYDHAGAHSQYLRALRCLSAQRPEDLQAAYRLHAARSELLRHLDDQPERFRALETMRGLAHTLSSTELRAEAAQRLANYHTEQDDYAEAVRVAQEALHDLGPHLDARRRAALMIEAGAALACLEEFSQATEALTPALALTRGVDPARSANVRYWLGHCAGQQGDWAAAREQYACSVRELTPGHPTRGRVLTLWKLGQTQMQLGEHWQAEASFRQADAEAQLLNAAPLRALCLSDLGLLLLEGGRNAEASERLQEAEACCGRDQESREAVALLRTQLDKRLGRPSGAGRQTRMA